MPKRKASKPTQPKSGSSGKPTLRKPRGYHSVCDSMSPAMIRSHAKWLLRYADWAEQKEKASQADT